MDIHYESILGNKLNQPPQDNRSELIKNLYRQLLNREADETGLYHWYHTKLSIDEIKALLKKSSEYKLREFVIYEKSKNTEKSAHKKISIHTIQPINKIVEKAFRIRADDWKGSLNIYMPGKTGEILFLLGYLPFLRRMIPKAKIILHTLSFYIPLVKNVLDGPDDINAIKPLCSTLTDSVNTAILSNPIDGFEIKESNLWVSPFRNWNKYYSDSDSNPGPFYRNFANAIGAIPNLFEKPKWIPLQKFSENRRIALALPTTNQNASIRRILPFSSSQWEKLADVLRKRGLTTLATGQKDDPVAPLMPGWTWMNWDLVDTVTMILNAEYLVSFSTGLAFAAASFGRAQIVMIDELNEKYTWLRYGLKSLNDVIDTTRLWAIFTPQDGQKDKQAYELALKVANQPSLKGGFTFGYPFKS